MSDFENYSYSFDHDAVVDSNGNPPPDPAPVDPDRFMASMARFLIEVTSARRRVTFSLAGSLPTRRNATASSRGIAFT